MTRKRALITGITGQDGSYLAEYLLELGYEVIGMIRRSSTVNFERIRHIQDDITFATADLLDEVSLINMLREHRPSEVYNLAAQSHVRVSFDQPVYTADVTGVSVMRLLEAIRTVAGDTAQKIRFYQASSSEMYGAVHAIPQSETTPFHPRSPYACAKVYAHYQVLNYREAYGMHASNGILFNHESPRRGETFVTRKITRGLARILAGKDKKLYLGNLDAKRDWGYAKDYVEAMWLMLQQDAPDDYVVATGETWSVRDFLDRAFQRVGLDWTDFVEFDPRYLRPSEVDLLIGDASKAKRQLGWEPRTSFDELVKIMVDGDLEAEGQLHRVVA